MSRSIGIAAIGDVQDINCWSSTPYYFYTTGHRTGLFNQPWSVKLQRLNGLRYFWNLRQLLMGRGIGGFQYSKLFLKQAETQIPRSYFSSSVISFNQVFPRAASVVKAGGKMFYYIDTTLYDLFNEPDYGIDIPASMKMKAIEQEKRNYAAATAVVTMGTWSHGSLIDFYQLPLYKIHQILPGANMELPAGFRPAPFASGAGITRDLILGFVGKDWKRKGLLLLLEICRELIRRGYRARIRAIGATPDELKNTLELEFTGFIDKQTNTPEFIEAIAACDFGCLLSTTEALGISTLEFLRVGVPVMGFYHQGMRDTLMEGASIRLAPGSDAISIADRLEFYIVHQSELKIMKDNSEALAGEVTWEKTVQRFHQLL
jgi:glycosyltransferase involved in cell wall biosynthesis